MLPLTDSLWPLFATLLAAQALRPGSEPAAADQVSDGELVDRARQGDPRALQELYQRYAAMVYRRLTHLVGPDPEREDIMQEVFIALFQGLDSFRGEARLRTYLYRIVTNKACDHLGRRMRQASMVRQSANDSFVQMATSEPSPESRTRRNEDAAQLMRRIQQLKPKKRIAFVLRVVEGLTLKEISEQVDASVHTVAQRIRHAKMELIELVRQNEDESKEDGP